MKKGHLTILIVAAVAIRPISLEAKPRVKPPNVLILTVDDMNCDSVGAFGPFPRDPSGATASPEAPASQAASR